VSKILTIEEIKSCVEKIAPLYDVKKVTLFGSYANGNATPKSDIDLLVEFGNKASYFTVFDIQDQFKETFKKRVDVVPGPIDDDAYIVIEKEILMYDRAV